MDGEEETLSPIMEANEHNFAHRNSLNSKLLRKDNKIITNKTII